LGHEAGGKDKDVKADLTEGVVKTLLDVTHSFVGGNPLCAEETAELKEVVERTGVITLFEGKKLFIVERVESECFECRVIMMLTAGNEELFDFGQGDALSVVVQGDGFDIVLVAEAGEGFVKRVDINSQVVAVYIEVTVFFIAEKGVFDEVAFSGLGDAIELVGGIIFQEIPSFYVLWCL